MIPNPTPFDTKGVTPDDFGNPKRARPRRADVIAFFDKLRALEPGRNHGASPTWGCDNGMAEIPAAGNWSLEPKTAANPATISTWPPEEETIEQEWGEGAGNETIKVPNITSAWDSELESLKARAHDSTWPPEETTITILDNGGKKSTRVVLATVPEEESNQQELTSTLPSPEITLKTEEGEGAEDDTSQTQKISSTSDTEESIAPASTSTLPSEEAITKAEEGKKLGEENTQTQKSSSRFETAKELLIGRTSSSSPSFEKAIFNDEKVEGDENETIRTQKRHSASDTELEIPTSQPSISTLMFRVSSIKIEDSKHFENELSQTHIQTQVADPTPTSKEETLNSKEHSSTLFTDEKTAETNVDAFTRMPGEKTVAIQAATPERDVETHATTPETAVKMQTATLPSGPEINQTVVVKRENSTSWPKEETIEIQAATSTGTLEEAAGSKTPDHLRLDQETKEKDSDTSDQEPSSMADIFDTMGVVNEDFMGNNRPRPDSFVVEEFFAKLRQKERGEEPSGWGAEGTGNDDEPQGWGAEVVANDSKPQSWGADGAGKDESQACW